MLLSEKAKLEELVVQALAESPNATAEYLRGFIEKKHRSYSVQAIYQELRKLEAAGIVTRRNGQYAIRFTWLSALESFSRSAIDSYCSHRGLLADIPAEGESRRWICSSLAQLLSLWTELTAVLLRQYPDRELFESVEHVWFHLVSETNEQQFVRAMKSERVKYFLVSCGDSALDRSYEPILKKLGARYSFGKKGFPFRQDQYSTLLGNFLFDIRLSAALNRSIEALYKEEMSAHSILAISRLRGRCVLTLRHDCAKACRERKKYARYFGL